MTDLQPDITEVLQEEPPDAGIVPVQITGPIRTQALPRKAATSRTFNFAAPGHPIRVLGANPRRASATLVSFASSFYVAFNTASKEDPSTMARWPAAVPLTITADTDVWVSAFDSTPMQLSVISENWAAGEGEI